ncbi:unknown [Clostridium sp. CAG:448]|nr:unknown [Clostridium sp. CAG:448]
MQLFQLSEIQRLANAAFAIRIRQRILHTVPHIRYRKLCNYTVINIFHHGVNYTFPLNHDLHCLRRHAEQVYCLNHFKSFVHQRCTVDRDFCSHLPGRVRQRSLRRHIGKLLTGVTVKRTAGRRQQNAPYFFPLFSAQTLENSTMLAVNRQYTDTMLFGTAHYNLPGNHQRFLICQRDIRPAFNRIQRTLQTSLTDDGIQNNFSLSVVNRCLLPDQCGNSFAPGIDPNTGIRQSDAQIVCRIAIRHCTRARAKQACLLFHPFDIISGNKSANLRPRAQGNIRSLLADRPGGTQQNQFFISILHHST